MVQFKSTIAIQENVVQIAAGQEFMKELMEQEARLEAAMKEKEVREKELEEKKRFEREDAERPKEAETLEREIVHKKREEERRERESFEQQQAGQDILERERLERERWERAQHAPCTPVTPSGTPPIASSNSFRTNSSVFFPYLGSAGGMWEVTSVGGEYSAHSGSVSNVNSGNTTNSIVADSHNDSSVWSFLAVG